MKKKLFTIVCIICTFCLTACSPEIKPGPEPYYKTTKCIMIGDSITELWFNGRGNFFYDNGILSAGIGGQTSTDILARFDTDVVQKAPRVASILCGINDIAQNGGYISNEDIMNNIATMAQKGKSAGISIILCSVLPSTKIGWNPAVGNPAPLVAELNTRIKSYAQKNGFAYLDYYSKFVNDEGGLPAKYTTDGVHVTNAAYEIMEEMFIAKLASILGN